MTIDWTKPVQTRDGRKVRVLCTDGPEKHPVIGIVEGCGYPNSWAIDGTYCWDNPDHSLTVVQVPEPEREIVMWVNVWQDGNPGTVTCASKADALRYYSTSEYPARIACVPVTIKYRPGDGL